MLKWLGTAEAADAANNGADAPFIAANSGRRAPPRYSDLQKKSAEVVGAAANIAQFLDRDTNADFATTVMIPSIQDFLKNPDDIDGVTASIQEQKKSIFELTPMAAATRATAAPRDAPSRLRATARGAGRRQPRRAPTGSS